MRWNGVQGLPGEKICARSRGVGKSRDWGLMPGFDWPISCHLPAAPRLPSPSQWYITSQSYHHSCTYMECQKTEILKFKSQRFVDWISKSYLRFHTSSLQVYIRSGYRLNLGSYECKEMSEYSSTAIWPWSRSCLSDINPVVQWHTAKTGLDNSKILNWVRTLWSGVQNLNVMYRMC